MNLLLPFFIFIFFLPPSYAELSLRSFEKKPQTETAVKTVVSLVTKQQFEETLREFISKSRPSRLIGTEGHRQARTWLVERLKKADPKGTGKITTDDFSLDIIRAKNFYQKDFEHELVGKISSTDPVFIRWNNFTKDALNFLDQMNNFKGQNIIWEKKGYLNPEDVLIIAANYDTLVVDSKTYKINTKVEMPGADSNASGVAILLSLAEVLSSLELPKTVLLLFTDADEFAFSGSYAFLEKYHDVLKKDRSVGQVSLTMLGHDSKSRDKEKKYGNMCAYIRKPDQKGQILDKKLVTKLASKQWDDLVKFAVIPNGFNSTGHSLFWEQGFPAVVFTQNWDSDLNPNEHSSNDIVETLNMSTLYGSYRFVAGAIIGWTLDL